MNYSKPIQHRGPAKLHNIKGLRVLQLYGTEEEMVYQHGPPLHVIFLVEY
ncbi:MAG: hypothetical protein HY390_05500 [Deltaproteobacteria bacterium]|nr:hypothetical protein [Deltaproteobacteria bacterium]